MCPNYTNENKNKVALVSKQNISAFLDERIEDMNSKENSNKFDSLIVYYSGHGLQNNKAIDSYGNLMPYCHINCKFNKDNCKSLLINENSNQYKPIFFVRHACRHSKVLEADVKNHVCKGSNIDRTYIDGIQKECDNDNMLILNATCDTKAIKESDKDGSQIVNTWINIIENLKQNQTNNANTANNGNYDSDRKTEDQKDDEPANDTKSNDVSDRKVEVSVKQLFSLMTTTIHKNTSNDDCPQIPETVDTLEMECVIQV